MTDNVEGFHDEEMGRLMERVQELLEGDVLCMVLRRSTGKLVLLSPHGHRREGLDALRTNNWRNQR